MNRARGVALIIALVIVALATIFATRIGAEGALDVLTIRLMRSSSALRRAGIHVRFPVAALGRHGASGNLSIDTLEIAPLAGRLTCVTAEVEPVSVAVCVQPIQLAWTVKNAPESDHLVLNQGVHRIQD